MGQRRGGLSAVVDFVVADAATHKGEYLELRHFGLVGGHAGHLQVSGSAV